MITNFVLNSLFVCLGTLGLGNHWSSFKNLNSVIKNRNSNSNDKFEELKTRSEININDKQDERHLNQNQQTFQSLNQLNENSNQKNLQKEPSLVPRVIPKPPNSKPQIPKNKPLM